MSSESSEFKNPTPTHPRKLRLAALIGVILVVGIVAVGVTTRASDAHKLKDWTDQQAVPTVAVVDPEPGKTGNGLELPGRLEAYSRAPIFARINGYLKYWKVDIGTQVKAGQLMAEIETPDVDQQLLQAKADYASAKANQELAAITAKRWQAMLGSDSVSKQEVDEKTGDLTAKTALANAAKANLDRLQATKAFARIVAPFDGVVTARNTDVGQLINVGGGAPGQELFTVSDVRKLRVYVQVPQNYVPAIKQGSVAQMSVPEHPGQTFKATVESSAQAVNAASGSTLVQLSVDNTDNQLMPGAFANVKFDLPISATALRVPASALVFDNQGLRVAVVGQDNKVTFKPVSIARDFGKSVELNAGLAKGDRVIESPPDGLADGDTVKIAEKTADKPNEKKA
ncbi:efflux RND transporter periplasmic adaptor subunit [Dyella sp.]|uniref:efflux RND transporter periplasmic adaptor subunit n=1 Tax=Dyella sp. TaxID=1869338 RepID=UPI002ED55D0A